MKLRVVACLLSILGLFALPAPTGAAPRAWTLGVLMPRGEEAGETRWAPTAEYLSAQLGDADFRLVPCSLHEMEAALERGELDFVLTNPGHYVELEHRFGISRIATLKNLRQGRPYTVFGAVIFTRADRTDIRSLRDLKGKSLAAVSERAFGGFEMAWRELQAVGIDPFEDLARLDFVGFPQDGIVYKVRNGEVDAGTVRTDILEEMARQGLTELSEFRVLNPMSSKEFPFQLSTRLYPEWAFSKARGTPEAFARAVAVALLSMPDDHPAALAGRYAGWTVPLDYGPVRELFRELNIGPYQRPPEWKLTRLARAYWWVFVLAGLTILFGVLHIVRANRLVVLRTRELSAINRAMESEIAEREKVERQTHALLQEKRFLARKCMVVQEDERRHLARELHDELGQCITAIQADAEIIQELSRGHDDRLIASAAAIQDVASRIYEVVHKLIERLRPSILDDLGLADTLRAEVDTWQARRPETDYELTMRGDLSLLDERLNISLFRIVQECLTNIAKHAAAHRVTLHLQVTHEGDGAWVELRVDDDGVGLEQTSVGSGLGLIGIRERAEALDGTFELVAAPGAGTHIRVRMPVGSVGARAAAADHEPA